MEKKLRDCLVVFFIFVIYLLIGSVIFSAIEKQNEIDETLLLSEQLNIFLDEHECVNESDLVMMIGRIREAFRQGAYSVVFKNTTKGVDLTWDTISGVFFCFTIVTTIGFGHITPKTDGGKVFCIIYASLGIPITGYLLSLLADNFERFWKWYKRFSNKRLRCICSVRLRRVTIIIFGTVPVLLCTLFLPSYYWKVQEVGWTYWTSLYYTFITMTTIGFGDYVASIDDSLVPLVTRIFDLIVTITTILLALGILTGILKIASKRIQKSKTIGVSRISTMMRRLVGNEASMNKDELNIKTISNEIAQSKTNGNHNQLKRRVYKEEESTATTIDNQIDSSVQNTHVEDEERRISETSQATDLSCGDISLHSYNRLELYINKELIISEDGLSDEMIANIKDVVKNHILEATESNRNSCPPIRDLTAVNGTFNSAFVNDTPEACVDTHNTHVHVDMHADGTLR